MSDQRADQPAPAPGGDDGNDESAADEKGQAPRSDSALSLVLWSVTGVAGVLCLVGLVVFGARAALGVAIGGGIALANLAVFVRVVRGVLSPGRRGRIWILVGIVKIFALFGGVWLLWRSAVVSPLSLVIGYGALPLGITLGNLLAGRSDSPDHPPEG